MRQRGYAMGRRRALLDRGEASGAGLLMSGGAAERDACPPAFHGMHGGLQDCAFPPFE